MLNKESDKEVDEMVFSDSDKSTEGYKELDEVTLKNIKYIASKFEGQDRYMNTEHENDAQLMFSSSVPTDVKSKLNNLDHVLKNISQRRQTDIKKGPN